MNRGFDYEERIDPHGEGRTLLEHLVSRYRHSDARVWGERILEGSVLVDGAAASPDAVLRRGQVVVWRRPGWEEPETPTSFELLLDDRDVLAVAKPAGLPTLPGGGFLEHTLLAQVRAIDPGASPLHRLGRWTSGVVLFARNPEAAAGLARQFAERAIVKRYRALASGHPERDTFTIDGPIGPVPHLLLGTVHAASPLGRPSRTRVAVVERRVDSCLCAVWIDTGRPHQIRIHLAAAGHPLVGDPLYPPGGVPSPDTRAVPGDPGYLLHAAEIGFRHPRTGEWSTVGCLPPADLRSAEHHEDSDRPGP